MANEFAANLKDAALEVSVNYPAAGANADSGSIDLGHVPPQIAPSNIEIEFEVPALAAHTDNTKTITHTIHDSADNSTFATLDPVIVSNLVGVASTGTAAKKVRFRLPSNCRRYIRVQVANPASGPAVTASVFKWRILAGRLD